MSDVEIKSKTSGIEYKPRPPGHLETTATHLAKLFLLDLILFFVCVCVCAATFSSVSFYFDSFVVHWGAEFMAVIVIKAIFPFLSISALDGTGCLLPRDRYLIVTLSGKQPLPK